MSTENVLRTVIPSIDLIKTMFVSALKSSRRRKIPENGEGGAKGSSYGPRRCRSKKFI